MPLERDRSARTIAISQESFLDRILARFNLLTKSLPRAPRLSNPITPVRRKALGVSPAVCTMLVLNVTTYYEHSPPPLHNMPPFAFVPYHPAVVIESSL